VTTPIWPTKDAAGEAFCERRIGLDIRAWIVEILAEELGVPVDRIGEGSAVEADWLVEWIAGKLAEQPDTQAEANARATLSKKERFGKPGICISPSVDRPRTRPSASRAGPTA
jgi:hypothetical protein